MEGLVSYGINPIRVTAITKQRSRFLLQSQPNLTKGVSGFQIGVVNKNKKKQFSPLIMAAAVGNSQVGHFENTLPSKGFHKSYIFVIFIYPNIVFTLFIH